MKSLLTALFMFVSCLTFAQINNAPTSPPLLNFTAIPYEVAFQVQTLIQDDARAKMLANPTGEDKVLYDAIQTQITTNGVLSGTKLYRLNNVPYKYYSKVVLQLIADSPVRAIQRVQKFNAKKFIFRQMKAQSPMIIKQIIEASNGSIDGGFNSLDSLINQ